MKSKITSDGKSLILTPTIFNILVVLSGGERHGYAILRELDEINEGRSKTGPTTLYRSIRTMLEGGLIEEKSEPPERDNDDERRRYYRLTDLGLHVLNDEVLRLEGLLKTAKRQRLKAVTNEGNS